MGKLMSAIIHLDAENLEELQLSLVLRHIPTICKVTGLIYFDLNQNPLYYKRNYFLVWIRYYKFILWRSFYSHWSLDIYIFQPFASDGSYLR